MPFPGISRTALFERLALGHSERLTVLTPNRRLAAALEGEVDAIHLAAGRMSWEAPDIVPFATFVERCHEEAVYSGADVPTLLTDAAERVLWEEAIRASRHGENLLSIPASAALAAEAWQLAHAWRIEGALRGADRSEESESFAEWAEHYARRTARDSLTDAARAPQHAAAAIASGAAAKPASLAVYAFDLLTTQQSDFLEACARAGVEVLACDPPRHDGRVVRTTLQDPRQELEHAARWARARLEAAPAGTVPRIGVVVPDLPQRRREVTRIFSRVFAPRGDFPALSRAPLFNLSLGEALSSYPLVDAALGLLELATGPIAYDRASRLLRSPFVAGSEAEFAARARLDAALRRLAPATLGLTRLRGQVSEASAHHGAPAAERLIALLDAMRGAAGESSRAAPHEWARRFTNILDAAGFPGERGLDSAEYQTLQKWRETLSSLAALGLVASKWSATEARSRLQRLCTETVFQPRTGSAPVQVLGLLESAGLGFDHLWLAGLTEDVWPIAARPQPLLSPILQRQAGIVQASPERSLAFDRAITGNWKRAAPEVVFSTAARDGDRELLASPLLAGITPAEIEAPAFASLREALFAKHRGAVDSHPDDNGPALGTEPAQGGTAILVDQAACPFRAFAHHRLGARALEHPEPGLGPMERGLLLHAMMAKLWEALGDHTTLLEIDAATLATHIAAAADHAVREVAHERPGRLEGRFADLERTRLAAVAHEWLAVEKGRRPFSVLRREDKMVLEAGHLAIRGRIDRVDRLEGGGVAVIDYKSGRVSVGAWVGERPDDAQLPLYALSVGEHDVRAVAFASLKTGELRFAGVARDDGAIPGVREPARTVATKKLGSWEALFAMWRREVDALGENYAAGQATVDPKRRLVTCERCDLRALCRIHERLAPIDADNLTDEPQDEEGE